MIECGNPYCPDYSEDEIKYASLCKIKKQNQSNKQMDISKHYVSMPIHVYESTLKLFELRDKWSNFCEVINAYMRLYEEINNNLLNDDSDDERKLFLLRQHLNFNSFVNLKSEYKVDRQKTLIWLIIDELFNQLKYLDKTISEEKLILLLNDREFNDFKGVFRSSIVKYHDKINLKYENEMKRINRTDNIDISSLNQVFVPYPEYKEFTKIGRELDNALRMYSEYVEKIDTMMKERDMTNFNLLTRHVIFWLYSIYREHDNE